MKKKYINPSMKVIETQRTHLLAGSTDAPVSEETQNNGDALAPEFYW